MEIKEVRFKVFVRPNSLVNDIIAFDKEKNAYIVKIKAKPENNRANLELIRFLSKVLQKRVKIKSGFKSKVKIIEAK